MERLEVLSTSDTRIFICILPWWTCFVTHEFHLVILARGAMGDPVIA